MKCVILEQAIATRRHSFSFSLLLTLNKICKYASFLVGFFWLKALSFDIFVRPSYFFRNFIHIYTHHSIYYYHTTTHRSSRNMSKCQCHVAVTVAYSTTIITITQLLPTTTTTYNVNESRYILFLHNQPITVDEIYSSQVRSVPHTGKLNNTVEYSPHHHRIVPYNANAISCFAKNVNMNYEMK